jgi:hypothetical protein
MEMRQLIGLCIGLAVLAASLNCLADDRPTKFLLLHSPKNGDGTDIELIDGKLLICSERSDSIDPNAKQYVSMSQFFDVKKTENGVLLILRTKWANGPQNQANLDLDGFYLSSDYSTDTPALKFTKKADKNSLWEVATAIKPGPFINKVEKDGKQFYLAIGTETVSLSNKWVRGHFEFHPVVLSFAANDIFGIREIDPKDDGR